MQLIEIPTDSEINDNVLVYWRPKQPLAAGAEVSFAYRQFWCWQPPDRPPARIGHLTRVGRGRRPRPPLRRRLHGRRSEIERQGLEMKPMLPSAPGTIPNLRVWPYPERACRVAFDLDPGSDIVCELRLVLEAGGKPFSETWLYRWTP